MFILRNYCKFVQSLSEPLLKFFGSHKNRVFLIVLFVYSLTISYVLPRTIDLLGAQYKVEDFLLIAKC